MESFQRVKVIGQGSFGAAVLVRRDGNLYVMKEVTLSGMSTKDKKEVRRRDTAGLACEN